MKHFDIFSYIFLIFGFVIGALAVYSSRFDAVRQFVIILTLCIYYLLWGSIYHWLKGDLKRSLIAEYLLVAAIAAAAAFLVFNS